MLNTLEKNIIIHALKVRKAAGEDLKKLLKSYSRLTDEEKYEVLEAASKEE